MRKKTSKLKKRKNKVIEYLNDASLRKLFLVIFIVISLCGIFMTLLYASLSGKVALAFALIYIILRTLFLISWYGLFFILFFMYFILLYKKNRILCLVLTTLVCFIVGILIFNYTHIKYDLSYIGNKDVVHFKTDNKVYYYVKPEVNDFDMFFGFDNILDRSSINSVNLDGSENKILCKNPKVDINEIVNVKDDQLYYKEDYNEYTFDLSRCEIVEPSFE